MATINYYLDKKDKRGHSPIHLRINSEGEQIKNATGVKVKPDDFNKDKQVVLESDKDFKNKNSILKLLKSQTEEYFENSYIRSFSKGEIKNKIQRLVKCYKSSNEIHIAKEQMILYGKSFNFIDLFAGAGGFSEGFLQAEYGTKYFNYILSSDINENCELTHIVRYNHQLGLDAKFLRKDITEPDFLERILEQVGNKQIDVICGGPPCQSFSLAGKRKKFDKKDDLFSHYLEVIKMLQPKYFVMENVKGILTKEQGKISELILKEIQSIVDIKELKTLTKFVRNITKEFNDQETFLDLIIKRINFEGKKDDELVILKQEYIKSIESKFKELIPKIVDYKTSKTDKRISTIRHGLHLLARNKELQVLQRRIIKEKDITYIDNDYFVDSFNTFLEELDTENIISKIKIAFKNLLAPSKFRNVIQSIVRGLEIYISSFEDCMYALKKITKGTNQQRELNKIIEKIRLYRIETPLVLNASNYGVPQNRERVLFIGCRKDQKLISEIKPTVKESEKVTIFEALYDLDFINQGENKIDYLDLDLKERYDGNSENYKRLLRKRCIDGRLDTKKGKLYAEWSKNGRLKSSFSINRAFYVRNFEDLKNGGKEYGILHNHQASNQNADVLKRLDIILKKGDYDKAKQELNKCGLISNKRNYNVLKADKQSPTIMTIPDDYIHFNIPRALTVREMARLQSFDDSFVFQGKRSTGGNKRKEEIPQYTLVGNAVPPLLARAVAMEILRNIK